ncbi:Phage protein [Azospirillaceae bacterium]
MPLKIKIDTKDLAAQCKEFAKEAERDIRKGVSTLARATHAHVKEEAQEKLHSSRRQFDENLRYEEVAEGIHVISVLEEGLFVEEGIKPGSDMKSDTWLLKYAKTNKKGEKYNVIPFEWSKAPSEMTQRSRELVEELKDNLKKQRVPFKAIERNARGSPRIGLLHEFNFGGEKPGKGSTPVFDRVRISQQQEKNDEGKTFTKRTITTFRTVKKNQEGKWLHPGLEAKKFLDEAEKWAIREWEEIILPEIFRKWK